MRLRQVFVSDVEAVARHHVPFLRRHERAPHTLLQEGQALDRYQPHFIEGVVDRLKPETGDDRRIRDSVARALNVGKGSLAILDSETDTLAHFSKHLVDPESGLSLQEPQPHSFSFNSPQGYCPHCKGLGTIVDVNLDTIIPDRSLSVAEGAIVPLGKVRENRKFDIIRAIARKYNFSLYDPVEALPDEAVSLLVYGSEDLFRVGEGNLTEMESWGGVLDHIEDTVTCPVCHGTRLNSDALCFKVDGKTIPEVAAMEMSELREWLDRIPDGFTEREKNVSRDILKELRERVQFMLDVGLDYLSLDRPTGSLSGGQRRHGKPADFRTFTDGLFHFPGRTFCAEHFAHGIFRPLNLSRMAARESRTQGARTGSAVKIEETAVAVISCGGSR